MGGGHLHLRPIELDGGPATDRFARLDRRPEPREGVTESLAAEKELGVRGHADALVAPVISGPRAPVAT